MSDEALDAYEEAQAAALRARKKAHEATDKAFCEALNRARVDYRKATGELP